MNQPPVPSGSMALTDPVTYGKPVRLVPVVASTSSMLPLPFASGAIPRNGPPM